MPEERDTSRPSKDAYPAITAMLLAALEWAEANPEEPEELEALEVADGVQA